MKNKKCLFRLLVIALVMGITIVGCDNGSKSENETPHTHSYPETWSNDNTEHWHECSCGDKMDIDIHDGDPCTICDYETTHTHSYPATWSNDDTEHWHECSCGDKIDIDNHSGNPCTECGYSIVNAQWPSNLNGTKWNTSVLFGHPSSIEFKTNNTFDIHNGWEVLSLVSAVENGKIVVKYRGEDETLCLLYSVSGDTLTFTSPSNRLIASVVTWIKSN